jgi:transposase InsO family protein
VKKIIGKCFGCKKRQSTVCNQKMSDLPEDRVTPSQPPFTYTGVDCFGPFEVKRARSRVKRYGVIFTCLSSRAIHLEVAHSLDTESFLNALRRFVARRGQPKEIRSDNGGNFVKGERELREAMNEWNQEQIHNFLLQRNVKWTFNPPAGSHFGGVWERCIRTVRKVMKALMKEQTLYDEGLNTLFCEVESVVNSRPITKLSDDPRDEQPLTPNHLLLLRTEPVLPPGVFGKEDNQNRRRWRQVQYLCDLFWRRWVREYLPLLQQRQKWSTPKKNVAVNDIVLVLDENKPRGVWPLARVLEVYANKRDGLVRAVKVRTSTSELVRPVDKIVLLEEAAMS